ncbi:MAG: hypothetical protein SO170_04560 [Butyribacter sp.]|nr:hypothetical protein [bacterium]MDY3854220.1 hypothetical protein [Butyribacter sp.]
MWQEIIYLLVFLGLLAECVVDVVEKKVWMPVILAEYAALFWLQYLLNQINLGLLAASLGIGLFFFVISVISHGQIGKGDAFLFGMTGAGLGLKDNIVLIYLTFLLAFIGALFLLIIKKSGRKKEMPLTPYILGAYLILSGMKMLQ